MNIAVPPHALPGTGVRRGVPGPARPSEAAHVIRNDAEAIAKRDRADVQERLDRARVAAEHGVIAERPLRVPRLGRDDDADIRQLCVDELRLTAVVPHRMWSKWDARSWPPC